MLRQSWACLDCNMESILFDAGPVEFAVEYNGTRLGAKFGEIDGIFISHGHWDHESDQTKQ